MTAETYPIELTINGQPVKAEVEARLSLVDFLRHHQSLTGTHVGCSHGVCGACTVMVDGRTARSCIMFAVQANGRDVRTVEGLAQADKLSVLQEEFRNHHALQCGYCTPGMLMSATALLAETPDPDEAQVRLALSGNLCRCTGYVNIIRAVQAAAARAKSGGKA